MKSIRVLGALAIALSATAPALAQEHVAALVNESQNNGIAFASKYQNSQMVIDDYVIGSSASPIGVASISVGAKPDKFGFPASQQATCTLTENADIQKFGALNKGAHIILTGKYVAMQGSTIMLINCSYTAAVVK